MLENLLWSMKICEIQTKECSKKAIGWVPKYKNFRGEIYTCLPCYELEGKYKPLTIEKK